MKRAEIFSSISHGVGVGLSIAALVVLLVKASSSGNVWSIVGVSIFGTSLILLYVASTLYHAFPKGWKVKEVFRRIDHSMIYFLIAGTYTPFMFSVLEGALSWIVFGIIWGMACLGIVWKSVGIQLPSWISIVFYIIMGWFALFILSPLLSALSFYGVVWLFAGGIFYTIGVIFYALDNVMKYTKYITCHDVFHIFVLAGSFAHFASIHWYVI